MTSGHDATAGMGPDALLFCLYIKNSCNLLLNLGTLEIDEIIPCRISLQPAISDAGGDATTGIRSRRRIGGKAANRSTNLRVAGYSNPALMYGVDGGISDRLIVAQPGSKNIKIVC